MTFVEHLVKYIKANPCFLLCGPSIELYFLNSNNMEANSFNEKREQLLYTMQKTV